MDLARRLGVELSTRAVGDLCSDFYRWSMSGWFVNFRRHFNWEAVFILDR